MLNLTERESINTQHELSAKPKVKIGSSRRVRIWAITLALVIVAVTGVGTSFVGTRDTAEAQLPPSLGTIIFDGRVTVNDSPLGVEGLTLTAKVGSYTSQPVTIGEGTPDLNGYENLTLAPSEELIKELIGTEIKFLLNGTVEAKTISYFATMNEDGSLCLTCEISLLDHRKDFVIDFPSLPATEPPPTATPTEQQPGPAKPAVPTTFSGVALTLAGPVPDGYELFAIIGNNATDKVTVSGGMYTLEITNASADLNGSSIIFYLIDKGNPTDPNIRIAATTTGEFTAGQPTNLDLIFPALAPTATPVPPTATPAPPTPTPVPPTPTPVPPTPTPVPPTPTPVPPTATPVPPTATPVPPTATPVPPTATPVPPTATPVPPTATPVPPTATPVPPTATPVPPTATPVPPTATPVPPTATPVPPAATPVPEDTGGGFNATLPLAIILALIIVGIAGYFGWQYSRRSSEEKD